MKIERDREAILAMAGTYEVTFNFKENVALRTDYELHEPFEAGATEFVEVIADEGDRILLQHVLVMGEYQQMVNKHWAQEWIYEDSLIYDFEADNTWKPRALSPAERRGRWTQRVTQVDDSPRYEAVGRWVHEDNMSYWTSGSIWRPIPRRESSRRSEYDVLVSDNRVTITPDGWTHEADNYKLELGDVEEPILVREAGLNTYRRISGVDFSAGRRYWQETEAFWRDVRQVWTDLMANRETVQLREEIGGAPLWQAVFELAGKVREMSAYDTSEWQPRIEHTIGEYLISGESPDGSSER